MIRLLIIVFALVVAVGAGLGGLIHFRILPDFTGMIVPLDAPEEPKEAPPPPRVELIIYDLDPMLVPVIRDGVLQRNIYIAVRLHITQGGEEKARFHMSQLHDVYLRALYDLIPKQLETRQTLDLKRLKARLKVITERVVGEGVVEDIMIRSVFER